jgi:hypothetical protein
MLMLTDQLTDLVHREVTAGRARVGADAGVGQLQIHTGG